MKTPSQEKSRLHPRSQHRTRYNFDALISACPELKDRVMPNKYGDRSIDFADPASVKLLNTALLKYHYDVTFWDIPEGYLCPPIPGRADYIHHIADILCTSNFGKIPTGSHITCMDVGTGANCIYPIVGHNEYGWSFIGSDSYAKSVESSRKIVEGNDSLKIKISIRQQHSAKNIFKGIESPWYKVRYGEKIGYILGGLISLTERKIDNIRCFVTLEKIESKIYILTRVISDSKTSYFENKSESHSENGGFCLKIFDNKGLEGISNIIFINYLPESCGANSGGYYLFFDKKKLHKVIDVTSSGDVGIWESENLYFPKDSLGIKNRIIYIKEKGEYSESETNETKPDWEKSSKIKIKLEWINNKLSPEPKTFANTVYN